MMERRAEVFIFFSIVSKLVLIPSLIVETFVFLLRRIFSILKEADDNTILAISKLPSDFTNLLMRISWNFENGPSTYFDLIYKKERGTIESLLADKIDLPVENISEFLKNFSIPPDSDFDYYKSEINIF